MRVSHLGPHSFISETPHPRHDAWLSSFTPDERRRQIEEDIHARTQAAAVMASAMAFGIVIAIVVYLVAL